MPVCIYCLIEKPLGSYKKVEHVIPQSFGVFEQNLTLKNTVCDECNQYFGETLDLYLARDTVDGINRFRLGNKPSREFRSLGRKSTLVHRADEGEYVGAQLYQHVLDGEMKVSAVPQIGFGKSLHGPFKWFLRHQLPSREELRALFESGDTVISFLEIENEDKYRVLEELRARGVEHSDLQIIRPAEWGIPGLRVETRGVMGELFGRAVAKVAFNYMASQFGAAFARMPQFNEVRRFILAGVLPSWSVWSADADAIAKGLPHRKGHVVTVTSNPRGVVAHVSFHLFARYRVVLAEGGFLVLASQFSGHFFDLAGRCVVRLVNS